jgi:hypothetical protein
MVSGQRHAPAALYSREGTSGAHWIGGWVGLRAGLDTETRGKILFPPAQCVVRHYTDRATRLVGELCSQV